jgi:hypothetical protein
MARVPGSKGLASGIAVAQQSGAPAERLLPGQHVRDPERANEARRRVQHQRDADRDQGHGAAIGLPRGLCDRARDRGGEAEILGDALRRRVAGGLHEATESGDEQRSWEQPEKDPEGNPAGEQRARPAAVELAGLERRVDECASVTQLVDAPGRLVASSNCAPAGRP